MNRKTENPYYHIAYWIFVILVLTLAFGFSWGNNRAAFFFVSTLLPIVLGTSYFFNYVLVPKFYLTKKYVRFALNTFYTAIISLYLEMMVLVFSFVYMVKLSYDNLNPNATQIILLAVILYLLVFIGSCFFIFNKKKEKIKVIKKNFVEKY
jgi:two-component system response regulator LytT